jgi:hypothetical protein
VSSVLEAPVGCVGNWNLFGRSFPFKLLSSGSGCRLSLALAVLHLEGLRSVSVSLVVLLLEEEAESSGLHSL